MAPKRKLKQNSELKWKPVAIECADGITPEDFEGLVTFEELDQYETIREQDSGPIVQKEQKKKNKKLKTQSKDVTSTDFVVTPIDDGKDLNMSDWKKLSTPDHIIKCLRELNMQHPTPIQKSTIKHAIDDNVNIYAAAPTGSGKTLAFAIPLLTKIVKDKQNSDGNNLSAIILTPTRELAVQIKKHIENISKYNEIKTALVVGGLAIQKQIRILKRKKTDIVVATPGRLWEIITDGTVEYLNKSSLSTVKYLVVDEADRMIEKAHFQELRHFIDYLKQSSSNIRRQYFILSATLTLIKSKKSNSVKSSENNTESLIKLLDIDEDSLHICDLTEGGTKSKPSAELLQEYIIRCLKEDKDLYLYYFVLLNPGRTIVFCNSIDCIRRLLNLFRFLQLNPLSVHSSMQQKRRLMSIEKFTSSSSSILIATDVAARGLDIPSVDHVVHYQVPRTAEIYIHRSGRTARIMNKGLSLILCDPQEEAFFLKDFSKILNKESLSEFDVNLSILKRMKERIKLAQACDLLEHKLRKNRTNENWFKSTAKACEIYDSDMDSSANEDDEDCVSSSTKAMDNRKLKTYQKQLNSMLRQKIIFPRSKIL